MTFPSAISSCLRKYFVLRGRAPRSEFWWWALFVFLGSLIAAGVDILLSGASLTDPGTLVAVSEGGYVAMAFAAITCIPSYTVAVRRLHDVNRTGAWAFLPLVLSAVVIYGALASASGFIAAIQPDLEIPFKLGDPALGAILMIVGSIALGIVNLALFVFYLQAGTRTDNYFGPNPLGVWSPIHGYQPARPQQRAHA